MSGSLTATDHVERIKGFKDALAQYPEMQIVFEQPDNDILEDAVTLTENALQAHPNIKGLFGSNASNPIGAARAVAKRPETFGKFRAVVLLRRRCLRCVCLGGRARAQSPGASVGALRGKSDPKQTRSNSTKNNNDCNTRND